MGAELQMQLLKVDLGFYGPVTTEQRTFLESKLDEARTMIIREGITLEDSVEHDSLVAARAAWIYRKRASDNAAPTSRMIRRQLNDILVSQKMSEGTE